MVADGEIWTLRPTFAPKQRSRNRLQPKHGRGLNRNSGSASVHSTRRVISPDVYFFARRFCSTSSIRVPEVKHRTSVKADRLRRCSAAEHPFVNRTHLFADLWPGKFCRDQSASTCSHCCAIVAAHFNSLS